jgi:hypothetical protein
MEANIEPGPGSERTFLGIFVAVEPLVRQEFHQALITPINGVYPIFVLVGRNGGGPRSPFVPHIDYASAMFWTDWRDRTAAEFIDIANAYDTLKQAICSLSPSTRAKFGYIVPKVVPTPLVTVSH